MQAISQGPAQGINVMNFVTPILVVIAISITPDAKAQNRSAIELSKLIEVFLASPSVGLNWSMGAGKSTPQIVWTSSGTESQPNCGDYMSCRRGTTRVLLNGKEMQHLRQRLEPVPWQLFMASESLAKFGPEKIIISPSCDTVECSFNFKKSLVNGKFVLTELCAAGPAPLRQIAYEVKQGGRVTYAVVTESSGSGGSSTSLTLYPNKPADQQTFCAEAKKAE
jgi:hypothetical protein